MQMLHSGIFNSCYISSLRSGNREGQYTGGSGGGEGLLSLVTSAICVRIRGHRSEVTRIVY